MDNKNERYDRQDEALQNEPQGIDTPVPDTTTDVTKGDSEHGHSHHHRHSHHGSGHHHSHHGSGHHHSSHSKKHSQKRKKTDSYHSLRKRISMWMNKHVSKKMVLRQNLVSMLLALVVIALLIYITKTSLLHHEGGDPYETQADTLPPEVETLPDDEYEVIVRLPVMKDVPLIHDFIAEVIRTPSDQPIMERLEAWKGTYDRSNVALPVTLDMSEMAMRNGTALAPMRVEVSEDASFDTPREFVLEDGQTKLDMYLLKTGMKYHYRVYFADTDVVAQGSFTTAPSPRILNITNVHNVRDIGGWETTDGKRVKQGLLYRGSELDGAVEPTYFLTPKGQWDMLEVLGIRYDMDLRGEAENTMGTHALGATVEHVYYGVQMYSGSFNNVNGREAIRRVFADLAKPENYPMYVHCTYGCDRTGTVMYLLEAMLGLSDEDLALEYELSSLFSGNIDRHNLKEGVAALSEYEGATTREKAESYLLSVGVTREEMASIRNIFLED